MIYIKVNGNLQSLKATVIMEIEQLYDQQGSREEFLPPFLAQRMAELTERINREISVYINRRGKIVDVSVGDNSTVSLAEVEGRRDEKRLSGIRCIHTHPNGNGKLSEIDINALKSLRLDAMAAVGVKEGKPLEICVGTLEGLENNEIYGPFQPYDEALDSLMKLIVENDTIDEEIGIYSNVEDEKAILVGLEPVKGKEIDGLSEGQRLLDELEELAITAGVAVLEKVLQKKAVKDAAFYIGKGKIEEIALMRQALGANVIIFDDELSGAQFRNIEEVVGIKVIDRTTLILDIFAQRARSSEGKLQVELAQLKYRLPRLMGLGVQLSRLGGGIGTRGPGEKKLEVDRRHIRRKINFLEQELKKVEVRRNRLRQGRKDNSVPVIALVGYTNAGKSTLLNKLCASDVLAENKLFATLDPTTRRFELSDKREALLIDTVGFIRKLPHDLIDAFKSTLEEAVQADIIIHVADASDFEAETQIAVVEEILSSLGVIEKPIILVLNKFDAVKNPPVINKTLYGSKVYEISALTGQGLDSLLKGLTELAPQNEVCFEIVVPYSEGWVLPFLHENAKILKLEYLEEGAEVEIKIDKSKATKIIKFCKL